MKRLLFLAFIILVYAIPIKSFGGEEGNALKATVRVYASDLAANRPIEAPNGQQWYNFDGVNKDLKKQKKKV